MSGNPSVDRENGPASIRDAVSLLVERDQTPLQEDNSEAPVEREVEAEEAETEEVEYEEPEGEEYEASDESEDDEEYEDEGDEETDTYTVRVDGEEVEVTLDELVNGYSRQKDYTKKTQSLAEQRKQFEAERQKVKQLEQEYAQRLQEVVEVTAQSQEQEPDWNALYENDPIGYVKKKADWDAQQQQKNRRMQELQELQQRQYHEAMLRAREQLPEIIPEWRNEETAKAEKQKVVTWALSNGFSQEELSRATDPRAVAVMRKAALYDEMMAKKPSVEKKVKKAPKVTKSGSPKTKGQTDQRRLREMQGRIQKSRGRDAISAAAQYMVARDKRK